MNKHEFKLYGYKQSDDDEALLELREVTVCVDAEKAKLLGEFFLQCSYDMNNSPDWEHEHFNGMGPIDLVVFKSNS